MSDYFDQVFDEAVKGAPVTEVGSKIRKRKSYIDEMYGGDADIAAEVENSDFLADVVTGADRNTPTVEGAAEITVGDFNPMPKPDMSNPRASTQAQLSAMTNGAGYATRWLVAPDDEARVKIIKEARPDARVSFDEKRNITVQFDGKTFALNKPGMSGADVRDFFGEALLAYPAARATRAISGVGRRMAATGAGEGSTMFARQQVSPDADTDLGQVLGSALAGSVAEGLTSILSGYIKGMGGRAAKLFNDDGTPNDTGRRFFERVGIDVEIITPELGQKITNIARRIGGDATRAFAKQADDEATDAVAGAARQAQADEFRIPLTRGQATGDIAQQRTEDAMRRGGRGEAPATIMREFDERQRQAMGEAGEKVSSDFGLGGLRTRQDAAASVRSELDAEYARLSREVDDAYSAVDGVEGQFGVDAVKMAKRGLVQALRDTAIIPDQATTPQSLRALQVFDRMTLGGKKTRAKAGPVDVRKIERFRQYLNSRINATAKAPDGDHVALIRMKATMDDALDEAMDRGLLYGDEAALETIKTARKLRADLGRRFGPRQGRAGKYDTAGKFIERAVQFGVTDNDMAKWLYGSAQIGESGRAVAAVKHLKDAFGDESPVVQNVRQGALFHALYGARDKIDPGATISPDVMATNLQNALAPASREYMKQLFSDAELNTLRRLHVAVHRAKNNRLAVNASGTAASVEQALSRAMGILGRVAGAATAGVTGDVSPVIAQVTLGKAGSMARTASSARGARQATSGQVKVPLPPPRPVFPAVGAALLTGVGAAAIDTLER